jgi:hypothetical protein
MLIKRVSAAKQYLHCFFSLVILQARMFYKKKAVDLDTPKIKMEKIIC